MNHLSTCYLGSLTPETLGSLTPETHDPRDVTETLRDPQTGLPKDSVANVSQVLTVDKSFLTEKAGKLRKQDLHKIESGLRLVMGL